MIYKDEEVTIIENDSVRYFLKNEFTSDQIIMDSNINYCIGVDTTEKDLILYKKVVNKNAEQKIIMKIDTVKIKKTDIVSIQKSELDGVNTAFLTLGIIAGVALITYAIALANNQIEFSE